jgi:hypothetical protein
MSRGRTVAQIQKDAQAVDLRRRNLTYRQIAAQMGFRSVASAHEAVARGLADMLLEPANELRQMEAERLDEMARSAWRVLYEKHVHVTAAGKIAVNPEDGKPLIDDGVVLKAIDSLLKISERRAKLLGLDQPTRVRAEVEHVDSLDQEIEDLLARLAGGGERAPAGQAGSEGP